jgi:hypothetical protein
LEQTRTWRHPLRRALFAPLALALALPSGAAAQAFERPAAPPGAHWYRGNTHSHTLESDGDSPPEAVARWYREHGYQFLVISDHNVWVDPGKLAHLVDSTFLLIPGEELTSNWYARPVHVNGLNVPHVVAPLRDSTLVGTVQKNVDAIRAVAGVPHINHPNFGWALSADVLAQVRGDRLLEIFNGHPDVHNHGGGDAPSVEGIWDVLLTGGKRIYGIAVDDAHHFTGEFAAGRSNPGRGWIVVRADRLETGELLRRLEAGEFYASTGVELDDVAVEPTRLTIHIRPRGRFRFTTEFIGAGGEVLLRTGANPAVYELRGGERYVRARVTDSGGRVAWVQPVFVE